MRRAFWTRAVETYWPTMIGNSISCAWSQVLARAAQVSSQMAWRVSNASTPDRTAASAAFQPASPEPRTTRSISSQLQPQGRGLGIASIRR